MNNTTRRHPRTTLEAWPHTPEYANPIEPPPKNVGTSVAFWLALLVGAATVVTLLVVEKGQLL